jgi:hypothetical protein
MKEKTATDLSKIEIPSKEFYSSTAGIDLRRNDIDPLLISLNLIKKQVKILENELEKQIELKKQKHNYKELWIGFDHAYGDTNHSYATTVDSEKKRYFLTWVKKRNKNVKIIKNKLYKISKMLEVYLNQSV